MVSCKNCGMLFHDTVDKEVDFERYYANHDYYAVTNCAGAGADNEAESQRYQRIFDTFALFLCTDSPSIVDIGAGQGGFLKWCKQERWAHPIAVEISKACTDHIREKLAIPAYKKFSEINQETTTIDIIVISHVIEHLFQPYKMLQSIVNQAPSTTLFYIEVPNASFYFAEKNPWKYLFFEHINHFDAFHLKHLLASVGLQSVMEGSSTFSPDSGDHAECLFMVCKKGREEHGCSDKELAQQVKTILSTRPDLLQGIEALSSSVKSISIWGISQYVQLLLGSSETLLDHLRFLIDISPAKCGRMLHGYEVKSPSVLSELEDGDLLLIPSGLYAQAMRDELEDMLFKGKIIEF